MPSLRAEKTSGACNDMDRGERHRSVVRGEQRYRQRLRAHGVCSRLYTIPQALHGFEALLPGSRLARDLFRENYEFLSERLQLRLHAAVRGGFA